MTAANFLRPIVRRGLSTVAGIAGIAELDDTAGLVPAPLVYDRRGPQSSQRARRLLRDGGPRGRAQLAMAAALGSIPTEHIPARWQVAAPATSRRAWFGRNTTKGGRDRETRPAGGRRPTAGAPPIGTPANPLGPCLGCSR